MTFYTRAELKSSGFVAPRKPRSRTGNKGHRNATLLMVMVIEMFSDATRPSTLKCALCLDLGIFIVRVRTGNIYVVARGPGLPASAMRRQPDARGGQLLVNPPISPG